MTRRVRVVFAARLFPHFLLPLVLFLRRQPLLRALVLSLEHLSLFLSLRPPLYALVLYGCKGFRGCGYCRCGVLRRAWVFSFTWPSVFSPSDPLGFEPTVRKQHFQVSAYLRMEALSSQPLSCNKSQRFPYKSLNTATVPYLSSLGSRTNTTPLALYA